MCFPDLKTSLLNLNIWKQSDLPQSNQFLPWYLRFSHRHDSLFSLIYTSALIQHHSLNYHGMLCLKTHCKMFYLLIILILVHISFIPLLNVVDVIINYFIGLLHRFKGVFAFQWVKFKTAFKASIFQTMFLMDLTLRNKNKISIQTEYSHREWQEC